MNQQTVVSRTPIANTHIRLDERGVAWIDDTQFKVIGIVLDKLADGMSPEETAYQHYNGLSCAMMANSATYSLNDVWGTDATHVWAVGTAGTILRWDGSSWTPEASGTDASLNALWGKAAARVWIVGEHGVILRRDL